MITEWQKRKSTDTKISSPQFMTLVSSIYFSNTLQLQSGKYLPVYTTP